MTSRIAITALLAIGALMGSAGAAFATSALSTDTSASAAQYGQAPGQQAAPTLGSGGNGPGAGPGAGSPAGPRAGVAGVTADSPPPTAAAQAPRQVQGDSDSLPFTGFAAIPLLLVGLALLTCGLVLRRRTGRESSSLSAA